MTTTTSDAVRPLTISLFAENRPGILQRVTCAFSRRTLNIDSLTVSPSEQPGLHRFTIAVRTTWHQAERLARQLEREVEVDSAHVFEDDATVHRDLALFKVHPSSLDDDAFARLMWTFDASVVEAAADQVTLQMTGTCDEVDALVDALAPWGVMQFVRSGRVALDRRPCRPVAVHREMQSPFTSMTAAVLRAASDRPANRAPTSAQ